MLFGTVLLMSLRPQYEASMIVAPVSEDQLRAGFVEGRFVTAPAREVQVPLGAPDFIRFEQSLRGAAVASLFFSMESVRPKLVEDTMWRWGENRFERYEDVMVYLGRAVSIDPVGVTASRRITYRHPDPDFAAHMLQLIRKIDDQLIRVAVRNQTDEKIQWLKNELKKTLNPDHRTAIAELLMMEERRMMLLTLDAPFAVDVIEDAAVLPRPVVPNVYLILGVSSILGMLGGVLVLGWRQRKSAS